MSIQGMGDVVAMQGNSARSFFDRLQRQYEEQRQAILAMESRHGEASQKLADDFRVRFANLQHELQEARRRLEGEFHMKHADATRILHALADLIENHA